MVTSTLSAHILGAGPTGSLAALALASTGCRVTIHDPQSATDLSRRSRAYAITHSSRRLLQRLELWSSLESDLIPFRSLDLRDADSGGQILFSSNDLSPSNAAHGAIGWILDHRPLMQLLLERLRSSEMVRTFFGTPPPTPEPNDLIIAADGPGSPTRTRWGIHTWRVPYRQGCLTSKVVLRGAPPDLAFELFRPEGPLAVLPLGDDTYQVVWSAPMQRCEQRAQLPTAAFLDALATVLPQGIEPDLLLDSPRAFPQQWMLARSLSRGRGVLIGEAAHRCHPVGGQGLNLCWRDVETLLNLAGRDLSSRTLARLYGRNRPIDVLAVGVATDLLVRMFSTQQPWLRPVRRIGLDAMARIGLLRRISLKAMTDGPVQLLKPLPE